MRSFSFGPLFDAVLLSAMAGCGGISTKGFDTACLEGDLSSLLMSGLSPDEPADYVALLSRGGFDTGGAWAMASSSGTACATATDATTCQAAIDAATADAGFLLGQCVQVCPQYILVVNRGDDVEVVSDVDGVRAQIGTVDTAAEAVWIASMAGYSVACGDIEDGAVREVDGGWEVIATKMTSDCDPIEITQYRLSITSAGSLSELESDVVSSEKGACVGRRPGGLRPVSARGRTALGAWLGGVASLEAAAVHAFAEIEADLLRLGAPGDLLREAARARRDEVRHARRVGRLARRARGRIPRPQVSPVAARSREGFARDNAVEGCVRETYGALVARWQAMAAQHDEIRRALVSVAEDEHRHAELSWRMHAWATEGLDADARARVEAAMVEALVALRLEVDAPMDPEVERMAGYPSREIRQALVTGLARQLALRGLPAC